MPLHRAAAAAALPLLLLGVVPVPGSGPARVAAQPAPARPSLLFMPSNVAVLLLAPVLCDAYQGFPTLNAS